MGMDIAVSIVVGVPADKLFTVVEKDIEVTYYDRYTGEPFVEKSTRVVVTSLLDQVETSAGRFYDDAAIIIKQNVRNLDLGLTVDGDTDCIDLSRLIVGFRIADLMYGLYSSAFEIPAHDPGTWSKEYGRIRELFGIEAQPYICVRISS